MSTYSPSSSGPRRVAVVVPLAPGGRDTALELLGKGPPFDPEGIQGLDRHEVFVTPEEAVFVFESDIGADALAQLLAEPGFWQEPREWQKLIAAPLRIAEGHSLWTRWEPADELSFLPTPGPGDSEGGDIY